jgi:hypothetical protein
MNRYTNLTPASFNPLSLEEIMMVPLAKQQRHDQLQMTAMQEGMFDTPYLDTDSAIVEQGVTEIKEGLTGIEDELASKGISRGAVRKMLELKRKKQEFLSPSGIGGKAASNYAAYQQNVKDIMSNSKADPQDQMRQIAYAKARYDQTGGVAEGYNYNPYTGYNTVDINKKLVEYGSKIKPIVQETFGWTLDEDSGMWWKNGQSTKQLPDDVIMSALAQAAATDSEIRDYLISRSQVDPGFDPAKELMNSIQGVTPLFRQNEYKRIQDFKYQPEWARGGQGNEALSFNSLEGKISGVNDIYSNIDVLVHPARKPSLIQALGKAGHPGQPGGNTVSFEHWQEFGVTEAQKEIWQEQGKKVIGSDFDINNIEDRKKLHEYLSAVAPFAGTRSVNIIDVSSMPLGSIAEGVSKDEGKWKDAVNKRFNAPGTKFMANGKFYNSKRELLKSLNLDPTKVKEVQNADGIVDWDNMLYTNLNKSERQWKGDFDQPIASTLLDGSGNPVQIYMSRKDSDMGGNPNVRKAYRYLNEVVSSIRTTPLIPEKIIVATEDGQQEVGIMLTPEGFAISEDGQEWQSISKEQLENAVLNRFDPRK